MSTETNNYRLIKPDFNNDDVDQSVADLGTNFDIIDTTMKGHSDQIGNLSGKIEADINRPVLKNGKIKLPSDFPVLPFNIYRLSKRNYTHNTNPHKVIDWSDATHVYISSDSVGTYSGLDYTQPISLSRFIDAYNGGVYGTSKKFILNMICNVYNYALSSTFSSLDIDVMIRSASLSGFTWMGYLQRPGAPELTSWVSDSSVYKSTLTTIATITDAINLQAVDSHGIPKPYTSVSSLSACQSTKGTFYQASGSADVYCNPFDGHDISDINLLVGKGYLLFTLPSNRTLVLENIGFMNGTYTLTGTDITSKFYLFRCKFYRGQQDALHIAGDYSAYLFNCVGAYPSKDCFNYYRGTDRNTLVVEVNCIGYGAGQYKLSGGNTTTDSNNGSTAHDGMHILRIGGKYWDCEGPTVDDSDDCYTINIGCEVGNILPTTTAPIRSGFTVYDVTTSIYNKYIIECFANGSNIDYGINGTSKTYYMDFEGNDNFTGGISTIDWEVVS